MTTEVARRSLPSTGGSGIPWADTGYFGGNAFTGRADVPAGNGGAPSDTVKPSFATSSCRPNV